MVTCRRRHAFILLLFILKMFFKISRYRKKGKKKKLENLLMLMIIHFFIHFNDDSFCVMAPTFCQEKSLLKMQNGSKGQNVHKKVSIRAKWHIRLMLIAGSRSMKPLGVSPSPPV